MAETTFTQAVANIVAMKSEILLSLWQTLIMVGLSTLFATLFGTILGICLYVSANPQLMPNRLVNAIAENTVIILRAFPFVILMIALIPLTRFIVGTTIGPVAASLILTVSGTFYFARLVEQNLREVPRGIIEAATAMGAKPGTIIIKVLLNEARAGMVSSITVLAIGLLSYSAAAGMIGGGGLGDLAIRYGYQRFNNQVMVVTVIVLVVLVQSVQSLGDRMVRSLAHRR